MKSETIEQVKIDKLIPYAKNSRTHSDAQVAQIAASIKEFGFVNPVLIDEAGGIIAGHGRVMAARKLGIDEVPCIRLAHLNENQKRAYVIADNKLALNAGWDEEMLKLEIKDLELSEFDISLLGFDAEELENILDEPETTEGLTEDDEVPEPSEDPITVLGDVWVLGKHRLMCGDSTSIDAVDVLMAGAKADMVFTDPPYGVKYQSNMSKRFDVLANDDKILDVAPVIWRFMGENTAAFVWTSHHVYPEWRAQFSGFYKQTIIWSKGGGGMGDLTGQYALDYEIALFCTKGNPKFRGQRGTAVWQVGKDAASIYVHPTQKPTALAERAIADFSDKGSLVMDLFGGSGSTLIACEKTGRQSRLMELDPKYVDVIIKRWQEFTGKNAIHEASGKTYNEMAA
jgi:DNA modification methylase